MHARRIRNAVKTSHEHTLAKGAFMKQKWIMGLLCCVLLGTLLVSCGGTSSDLIACGEDVISLMAEMVVSEEFAAFYNLPASYSDTISRLREGDYRNSIAVYELSVSETALLTAFDVAAEQADFSETLYQHICSSVYVSFASHVNQAGGVEAVTVATAFSAQKSFAGEVLGKNQLYLYVFERGCPILVSFVADGDDAYRAVGYFLLNEAFATESEESIRDSCEDIGIHGVTVQKR